jgi:cobalt-zinc-cadmium efflux system protein
MSHRHESFASDGALDKKLWATAALNVVITLAEFIAGFLSGSLALLSDATHNFSDVVAIILAVMARRLGRRPPTTRHSYGFKRVEVVAALVNAVTLVAVTVLIAREAVLRLLSPEPVAQGIMLVMALIALGANVGSVLLLRRHDRNDVNVRGAFLHMAQDALASLVVVVAALFAHSAAGPYADAIAALLVSLVVLRSALSLAWQTLSTILEGVPADVDLVDLADRVGRTFAPASLHHIHVWEIGPSQRLLTGHVMVGQEMSGRDIEDLLLRIKEFLHEQWQINHATLEPEISGCERTDLLGCWEPLHNDEPAAPSSSTVDDSTITSGKKRPTD